MNWEAVTGAGTVFTGLVIVATAYVGIDQLKQFRRQRRDVAAVELVRSIQDDTFLKAYRTVFDSHAAGEGQHHDAAYDEAAVLLGFRFEMIGVMVHRGAIPFDIAEDLVGGLVLGAWNRLKDSAVQSRVALGWPAYLEWFQWLAERFESRKRLQKTPAYAREKDWNPP